MLLFEQWKQLFYPERTMQEIAARQKALYPNIEVKQFAPQHFCATIGRGVGSGLTEDEAIVYAAHSAYVQPFLDELRDRAIAQQRGEM